jgi:hypothetical protein
MNFIFWCIVAIYQKYHFYFYFIFIFLALQRFGSLKHFVLNFKREYGESP